MDYVASLSVPHSYFTHFYVASVLSSVFWAVDVLRSGPGFSAVVQRVSLEHLQTSMSLYQVLLCWALLMVQAFRRLFESVVFAKPSSSSSSRMWFVHWLLGIAFYMAASIAIWIEGAGMLGEERTNEKPTSNQPRNPLVRKPTTSPLQTNHPALPAHVSLSASLPPGIWYPT